MFRVNKLIEFTDASLEEYQIFYRHKLYLIVKY
jgi:hypothetical protein